jgi:hypothetical protein
MRWITKILVAAALLTMSAVAVVAQAKECTEDFKTATYSKWYDARKEKQDVAYEAAKEYVAVCPTDESQYSTALKKFIADYDRVHTNQKLATDFEAAVKAKNYAEQIRLGKQLTATNPDNAVIYIIMASAGLGDPNLLPDSAQASKKAIELIEASKPFAPTYHTKDQALSAMNYVLAKAALKTSPVDAISYFIKAAKYESDLKKSALLYNELAGAYGDGPVAKLTEAYKEHVGKPETDQSKLILANLNQAIDRQIDALARAAALADAANKPPLMERLTELYEFRNKTKQGVDQLVAGVLSKPLPEPPTPITTLPTPAGTGGASAGTPPGNTFPSGSGNAANPSSTAPANAGSKPASTGAPTTPAKPTASPTPRPKQRRSNHRRGQ